MALYKIGLRKRRCANNPQEMQAQRPQIKPVMQARKIYINWE